MRMAMDYPGMIHTEPWSGKTGIPITIMEAEQIVTVRSWMAEWSFCGICRNWDPFLQHHNQEIISMIFMIRVLLQIILLHFPVEAHRQHTGYLQQMREMKEWYPAVNSVQILLHCV